jgi:hypothetical protein
MSYVSNTNNQVSTVPSDFAQAVALLKSLIASRTFRKERLKEDPVKTAIRILLRKIEQQDESENRLEAVSLLGKASEVSKSIAAFVREPLERSLILPLPPIGEWGNADDRYYLAKGVSVSPAPWVADYAAIELARAGVSEKRHEKCGLI